MNTQIVPTELIPVSEHEGRTAVSGRALHEFLEVDTAYTRWMDRMIEYGFTHGEDFLPLLAESTGGRPSTDHMISLDMAKELSMIQRTEKGKRARQYFIEVEKRAKTAIPTGSELMALAVIEAQNVIASKDQTIAVLAPKAEAWSDLVSSAGSLSFRDAAKVISEEGGLTISGPKLTQILMDWRWVFRPPATPEEKAKGKTRSIRAYQTQIDAETLTEKARTYTDQATGEKMMSNNPQTRVTGKGLDMIRTRLLDETETATKELF